MEGPAVATASWVKRFPRSFKLCEQNQQNDEFDVVQNATRHLSN
jgi:hypothetical protein